MKRHLWAYRRCAAVASLLLGISAVQASDYVTLWIEKAPSLSGPWTRIDLDAVPRDANGNIRLPANQPNEFYRTQIDLSPSADPSDPIPLEEVPKEFLDRAIDFLKRMTGPSAANDDEEGWPEGVQLAPHARGMNFLLGDGSVRMGYLEFKLLLPALPPSERGGPAKSAPEDASPIDAGYLLLSVTDEDFPIAEFATSGPTPFERLARLAKTSRFQLMRYGPTFLAAEDEKSNLLASEGEAPFKLDPAVLQINNLEWVGDSDTGLDNSPHIVPQLKMEHYHDYHEFKHDFATNPIYQKLREIKKARAKLYWDLARGLEPEGVTVMVSNTAQVLNKLAPEPALVYSFISEDGDILSITPDPKGGLNLQGLRPGEGLLRVLQGNQEYVVAIQVRSRLQLNNVSTTTNTWYAGNWGQQPKYYQLRDPDWCDLVGCGPTAWAMLFAWFERVRGVDYAFNYAGQAPPDLSTTSNRAKVKPVYRALHELCDVICNPFGDGGGTWPTDMTEGFKAYTYTPALTKLIGRSWHINAVTGTWPDEGALRSAEAIKKGYPAVTGLGYLWHYVLAYGYTRETWTFPNGYKIHHRYIKCNMGWNNSSPKWYHLGDTFYAADCKLWKGSAAS